MNSKVFEVGIKLMYHRPTRPHMEQNDTKSVARSSTGVELCVEKRKEDGDLPIFVQPGS